MLKALIVDDEEWIRLGLREQVDWKALDIKIVGEANNGAVAVEMLESKLPDIVLTDIRMPIMDGIGLMEYIQKYHRNVIVIAISGYSDFEYARKALVNKAFDYVLKPIEEKKLEEILNRAVAKINEENEKKNELLEMREQIKESNAFVKDKLLTNLILNPNMCKEEFISTTKKLGVDFDYSRITILIGKIINFAEVLNSDYLCNEKALDELLHNVVSRIAQDMSNILVCRNHNEHDELIFVYGSDDETDRIIYDEFYTIASQIKKVIDECADFHLNIGIGSEYGNVKDIRESYLQAMEAVYQAGFLNCGRQYP